MLQLWPGQVSHPFPTVLPLLRLGPGTELTQETFEQISARLGQGTSYRATAAVRAGQGGQLWRGAGGAEGPRGQKNIRAEGITFKISNTQ